MTWVIPTLRRYVQQISDKHKLEVNLMVQNMEWAAAGPL